MYSILCIDDDPILLKLIVDYLKQTGFEVRHASNGAEGIKMFEMEHADLILTDLRMPVLSGFEVLEHLVKKSPDTPVIVLSGIQTVQDAIEAMKIGAWDYITKPVESFTLLELAINKALERAELVRENKVYREHLEDEVKKRTIELSDEIRERRKLEGALRESLKEKEFLLKEIHHRVKNNLQIISSLLSLQTSRIDDEHFKNIFFQSQNRIKSMAIVHEELYISENFSKINFKSYVRNLVAYLSGVHEIAGRRIGFDLDVDNIELPISNAIPCGLILTELVTNAYKHAFSSNCEGAISIRMKRTDEKNDSSPVRLIVSDNGAGLPKDFHMPRKSSLGMQLVSTLVSQIHGDLEIASVNGTSFTVTFPAEDTRKNQDSIRSNAGSADRL